MQKKLYEKYYSKKIIFRNFVSHFSELNLITCSKINKLHNFYYFYNNSLILENSFELGC
jgi:hypothetical protein